MPLEIDGRRVLVGIPGNLARLLGANSAILDGAPRQVDVTPVEEMDVELVHSPMTGKVVKWLVDPGTTVDEGTPLVVLEAMKMENVVPAPRAGRLAEVIAPGGSSVKAGAGLARISTD